MMRAFHLVVAVALLLSTRVASAQRISPVAAYRRASANVRANVAFAPPAKDANPGVGPVPYVLLGTLVGAGAVTLYLVHDYKTTNGADDGFFIPPAVFVTVGLGGLAGGVIGYMVYEATR